MEVMRGCMGTEVNLRGTWVGLEMKSAESGCMGVISFPLQVF